MASMLLDIMVPDFFLWRHLKDRVYRTHTHTTQELEHAIQCEIALINQDQNFLHWVVDNSADHLRQSAVFCEHNTGVFDFNILQQLNKLLHIKMCFSALRHSLRYFLVKSIHLCPILEKNQLYLSKYSFLLCWIQLTRLERRQSDCRNISQHTKMLLQQKLYDSTCFYCSGRTIFLRFKPLVPKADWSWHWGDWTFTNIISHKQAK